MQLTMPSHIAKHSSIHCSICAVIAIGGALTGHAGIAVASLTVATAGVFISHLKLQEHIQEQDKAIRQFTHDQGFATGNKNELQTKLAHIGHEVRTPLNGIIGMLELSQKTDDLAAIKNYLDIAQRSSKSLLGVLNNNIDAAKYSDHSIVLHNDSYSLLKICEELATLHANNAAYKGLNFNLEFDPRLFKYEFSFDQIRIAQVLNNLINNAIKYTLEGNVKFWVTQAKSDQNMINVRFIIQDTGVGISTKDLEKIGCEFEQIDNTLNNTLTGSGLGVFITHKILKAMGSSLVINSHEGTGTTAQFELRLPITKETSIQTFPRGTNAIIIGNRNIDTEVLRLYLDKLNADTRFVNGWDEEQFRIQNDLIFIEECIALEHSQRLHQISFSKQFLNIFIIRKLKGLKSEKYNERLASYKTLNQPVEPSKLFDLIQKRHKKTLKQQNFKSNTDYIDKARQYISAQEDFKILAAEDNQVNQFVLKKQCEILGIENITIASTGIKALEILEKQDFDLILMDFNMPQMNGIDATTKIKELGIETPIIGITAQTFDESKFALDIGMSDVIQKPAETQKIAEAICRQFLPEPESFDNRLKAGMVVDKGDDVNQFDHFFELLQEKGIELVETITSKQNIQSNNKLKLLDYIFLDINSSDIPTHRDIQRIRNAAFKGKIIALTAAKTDLLEISCKRAGVDECLTFSEIELTDFN